MSIKTRAQFFELFTHNSQYMRDLVDTIVPAKNSLGPGPGITDAANVIIKSGVQRFGEIIKTTVMFDMTGLKSGTSDLDIIGEAVTGDDASLFQVKAAEHGTILMGTMTCLEVPASLTDFDLYSATVSTGEHEDLVTDLVETALLTSGAAWTLALTRALTLMPPANGYLYLVNGAADTADDFTAGRFLLKLYGYDA